MKKNIFYFLIAFLFLAAACNKEEEIETYDLGTEFLISAGSYTSLDDHVTISIENQQKNLSEIAITHLGGLTTDEDEKGDLVEFTSDYTGTISITDGEGSISLTDDQLGMTEIGWKANFQFDATFDGKAITRYKSIKVKDPMSVTVPVVTHRDTTFHVLFTVKPATATVGSVKVETKIGENGTYGEETGPFEAEDSLAINGLTYNNGDTVFVKVSGTVGTKTATKVGKVIIEPYSYENVNTFTLDSTTDLAVDLIENRVINSTTEYGDSSDIKFNITPGTGSYTMGFSALHNAQFVVSNATAYTKGDIYDTEHNPFSSIVTLDTDVAVGDVYIFRTKRGTGDYSYGIMKVTAVEKPQGVMDDSYIEITVKN